MFIFILRREGVTSHTLSSIVGSPSVHLIPDPATCSRDPDFEGTNTVIDLS